MEVPAEKIPLEEVEVREESAKWRAVKSRSPPSPASISKGEQGNVLKLHEERPPEARQRAKEGSNTKAGALLQGHTSLGARRSQQEPGQRSA